MKIKHFFFATFALLCCATLMTACGSDGDDNEPKPNDDNKRVYVAMWHYTQLTDDMLAYCNVEITTINGVGKTETKMLTKDDVQKGEYMSTVVGPLPCELTVKKTVTLKPEVDFSAVSSIKFYRGYYLEYAFYNAKQELIKGELHQIGNRNLSPSTAATPEAIERFKKLVNEGSLNKTVTIAFDKDGNEIGKE